MVSFIPFAIISFVVVRIEKIINKK
jgi:hypothetical protein